MSAGPQLDREGILTLLRQVSDELAATGSAAVLFIVGGAAMALAYDGARATRDVDALFQPSPVVREVAARIAARHGLEDDWLNDAAKGFLPGDDAAARTVLETDNLLVQVASPRYLLAMKVHSGRPGRDIDDAVRLFRYAGLTNADELIALLETTYPPQLLQVRHRYIALEVAQRALTEPTTQ